MRVSALKWGLNQPKTMSLNQLLSIFIVFLTFLQMFKEGQKQGEMPYIGILVFLTMFGVCSDPCACSGVTKVVPGILPVHWDTIGAFSAFKVEI